MSRNARCGVSIVSAVSWMDEYLRTGRTAPKPRGGDRRSGRIEAQADLLMAAIEESADVTWRNCAPRARAQPSRRALPRRRPAWPPEDDDADRGPGPRRPHRAEGPRRGDERNAFTAYAETLLDRKLAPGDIVILDNLPAHKVSGARAAIARAGATTMVLPPYSPDFNPIEQVFAKFRALLRKAARTIAAWKSPSPPRLTLFSLKKCANYFTNSG